MVTDIFVEAGLSAQAEPAFSATTDNAVGVPALPSDGVSVIVPAVLNSGETTENLFAALPLEKASEAIEIPIIAPASENASDALLPNTVNDTFKLDSEDAEDFIGWRPRGKFTAQTIALAHTECTKYVECNKCKKRTQCVFCRKCKGCAKAA